MLRSERQQISLQVHYSLIFLGNENLICKSLSHKSVYITHYESGVHKFSRNLLAIPKFLSTRWVTNNCHNDDPQMLGSTVRYLVTTAIWLPEFAHKF